MLTDQDSCYRVVQARDSRFDGVIYTAVLTTGIYCRPSCPSRLPLRMNVRFFGSAAAAVAAGFRACRRCRPDSLPGSRAWDHRGDLVARALRLIADGAVDEQGVAGLAARLSVSERHLHRSVVAEVGVGPLALARTRRAQTARLLIDQTALSMTEVAFASGFASIRQFNDVMRTEFGCSPSAFRRTNLLVDRSGGGLVLRLVHREPYDAQTLFGFLAMRAVPGVESGDVHGLRRVVRTSHGLATVDLVPAGGHVTARIALPDLTDLGSLVARLRRLLDSDADPLAVAQALSQDRALAPLVASRPGLRVPGTVDGFELAVKAILGQQVSVAGARTLAGRLALALGEELSEPAGDLARAFPTAEAVADASLDGLGLTGGRSRALRALATAVADGSLVLDAGADREEARQRLLALPGVGPWTAGYIAMRALGDPDGWPSNDLVLDRWTAANDADSTHWRPWRAYAALHLWSAASSPPTAEPASTAHASTAPASTAHASSDIARSNQTDQGASMTPLDVLTIRTPVGELVVITDDGAVIASGFTSLADQADRLPDEVVARGLRQVDAVPGVSDAVTRYFEGDVDALDDVPVRQPGGAFSQHAWEAMRSIPAGQTLSYAELATKAGNAHAVRAAGTACARNMVAPFVPCHRVVRSDGSLGGYYYGLGVKQWLLAHEGGQQQL